MLDELDDGARIGVWTALGVVALLLLGLLGGLAIKTLGDRKAALAMAAGRPAVAAPSRAAAPVATAPMTTAPGADDVLDRSAASSSARSSSTPASPRSRPAWPLS